MRLLVSLSLLGVAAAAMGAAFSAGPTAVDLATPTDGFNITFNVTATPANRVGCIVTWTATDFTNKVTFWKRIWNQDPWNQGTWSGYWTADGTVQVVTVNVANWQYFQWGRTYSVYCATTIQSLYDFTSMAANSSDVVKFFKPVACACKTANVLDDGSDCPLKTQPSGVVWPQCWCQKKFGGYDCADVLKPKKCPRFNCNGVDGSCNRTFGYGSGCSDDTLDMSGNCNICNYGLGCNMTNNKCYTPVTPAPTPAPTLANTVAPTSAPTVIKRTLGQSCNNTWVCDTNQGECEGNGTGTSTWEQYVCREWRNTGDYCTHDYQCGSLMCNTTAMACLGVPNDGPCTQNFFVHFCLKGSWCGSENKCIAQKGDGEVCTKDEQCAGPSFCAKINGASDAKCTYLFSQAPGTKVEGVGTGSGYVPQILCSGISRDPITMKCLPPRTPAEFAVNRRPCQYDWECGDGAMCGCTTAQGMNNATCWVPIASPPGASTDLFAAARIRSGLFTIENVISTMKGSSCPRGGFLFFTNLLVNDKRREWEASDFTDYCFGQQHNLLTRQIICEMLAGQVASNVPPPCLGGANLGNGPSATDITNVNNFCAVANVWGVGNQVTAGGMLPPALLNSPRFVVTASCTDRVKNGAETDVDCGGACPKCPALAKCTVAADCRSNTCTDGWCVAATTCGNAAKDAGETDVDCGGPCRGCDTDKICANDWDCDIGLFCKNKKCAEVTDQCNNGMKDAGETDVDCGGTSCPTCADGQMCDVATDCSSSCLVVFTGSSSVKTCGTSASAALRPSLAVLVVALVCTLKSLFA